MAPGVGHQGESELSVPARGKLDGDGGRAHLAHFEAALVPVFDCSSVVLSSIDDHLVVVPSDV
jgi:hypothetical protein